MAAAQPAASASAPAVPAAPPRLGEGRSYSARIAAEVAGSFLLFFGALGIGMFNPQGSFGVPFGFGFAVRPAFALACDSVGRRITPRIAMIAVTTSNSTKVNPPPDFIVRAEQAANLLFVAHHFCDKPEHRY